MDCFIERLAGMAKVTPEEAADHVDRLVHDILIKLRKGENAVVPGIGVFKPGPTPRFEFKKGGPDVAADKIIRSLRRRT